MNTFKRTAIFAAVVAGLALAGCGLTPKQIEAMGKMKSSATMAHSATYGTFKTTTVITVAGDGKQPGVITVQPDGSTFNGKGVSQ